MLYVQWQEVKEQDYGHIGPKGTFKLNLCGNDKYLFQLIVEDLIRANNKYNVTIPWYIMTSDENCNDTIEFLEKNNYFGYKKEYVCIFKQGELPLLSKEGKVLINEKKVIKEASNGNGAIFKSMLENGVLDDMQTRGIEWVFIGSVDNVLVKNVDAILLGLTEKNRNLIGTKTVHKKNPEEKVGVFCMQNNRVKVVEYTEIKTETAHAVNKEGELVFGDSHIMCNLFNINALKKCTKQKLDYHVAIKKASYLDNDNNIVNPEEPNSFKFEQFIFDSFKLFDNISILRGKREENFAPIKNETGEDSPETAKKLYENYWKNS